MKGLAALVMVLALPACTPTLRAHRIEDAARATPITAAAPTRDDDILAAYMHARDVDTHAYGALDTSALASAYAKAALADRVDEIEARRREGRPMAVRMEFHPRVTRLSRTIAIVDDDVRNHSVRLDPTTQQPIEADPDELLQDTFTLELLEDGWRVTLTARVGS